MVVGVFGVRSEQWPAMRLIASDERDPRTDHRRMSECIVHSRSVDSLRAGDLTARSEAGGEVVDAAAPVLGQVASPFGADQTGK